MSYIKLADKVRQVYEELAAKSPDHGVAPQDLLEASRSEDAILHNQFEWDNNKAAEGYRVWQARMLLRTITVEVSEEKIREYQNIVIETEAGKTQKYYHLSTVMSDEELKAKVLAQLAGEVRSIQDKYRKYQEVFRVINEDELKKIELQYKVA
jgi:hypothetical protein